MKYLYIDCDIDGQVYEVPRRSCPRTCSNPYLHCISDNLPGCSCPRDQVIDELNNRCVPFKDCPSKKSTVHFSIYY